MLSKQDIIKAIQEATKKNNGQPLGRNRFTEETGIKAYDWQKFWARLGDAQKEAGFEPNILQQAYGDEFVVGKMIVFMRKLG